MLEKTVFTRQEIINKIQEKYNISITKIEQESRGSANIFYVYDNQGTKYVLKEFESACNQENVIKEIKIINHLKSNGIKVPNYIKTENQEYYFKYKNRTVILMEFINGYTKESNTGTTAQVIESAEILGKVAKSLENYEDLPEDLIEKWCNNNKLREGKKKFIQLLKRVDKLEKSIQHGQQLNLPSSEIFSKIKLDINQRMEIITSLEKMDFSEMTDLTLKNSHGDYSIMQFIYKDEKVEALLDFAKARKMPIAWEIIRSFTYIDKDSENGDINIENLLNYTKVVMKYISLTKCDLKWMPYFYLIQLVSSPFGYEEYLNDNSQKKLLEFAFWRCKMSKTLFEKSQEISGRILQLLN